MSETRPIDILGVTLVREGSVYVLKTPTSTHRERRLAAALAVVWQVFEGEDFKYEEAVRDLITGLAQLAVDNASQHAKAADSSTDSRGDE